MCESFCFCFWLWLFLFLLRSVPQLMYMCQMTLLPLPILNATNRHLLCFVCILWRSTWCMGAAAYFCIGLWSVDVKGWRCQYQYKNRIILHLVGVFYVSEMTFLLSVSILTLWFLGDITGFLGSISVCKSYECVQTNSISVCGLTGVPRLSG